MTTRTFTYYFPLWGVDFDSDDYGLLGGDVIVCKPYDSEWTSYLKSAVFQEMYRYPENEAIKPQVCLNVVTQLSPNETMGESFYKNKENLAKKVNKALLTLKLLRRGWIQDPWLTGFGMMDSEGRIDRYPGPYRQIFLAGLKNNFPDFYQIKLKDLAQTKNQSSPTVEFWNLIQNFFESGGNQAMDIAIENFNLSYSLNISNSQKISFLFTALDAMLGGMSLRKNYKTNTWMLHNTEMKFFFKERLIEILKRIEFDRVNEEGEWMDGPMRKLRNKIAHGSDASIENESEKYFQQFQDLIRIILPDFMKFCIQWNTEKQLILKQLEIPKKNISLVEAYNKRLEFPELEKINA